MPGTMSTLEPLVPKIAGMLLPLAAGLLIVAALSWYIARKYGGKSRRRREAIFGLVSAGGVLLLALFHYLRMTGRL
jgi:hypothetical protein